MAQGYFDRDEIFLAVHWVADEIGDRKELKFSELYDKSEEFERLANISSSFFLVDFILGHWESKSLIETKTLPAMCSDGVYYDYSIAILCPTEALRQSRPKGPFRPDDGKNHPMPRGMKMAE